MTCKDVEAHIGALADGLPGNLPRLQLQSHFRATPFSGSPSRRDHRFGVIFVLPFLGGKMRQQQRAPTAGEEGARGNCGHPFSGGRGAGGRLRFSEVLAMAVLGQRGDE
jgi:hypothetical protein